MRRPQPLRRSDRNKTKTNKPATKESVIKTKKWTFNSITQRMEINKNYKATTKVDIFVLSSHSGTKPSHEADESEGYDSMAATPKVNRTKLGKSIPSTERKHKPHKYIVPNLVESASAPPKMQRSGLVIESDGNMVRKNLFSHPYEDDDNDFYINYHPYGLIGYEDIDCFVIPEWMPMAFRPPHKMNLNDICSYTAAYIFQSADQMITSDEVLIKTTSGRYRNRKTLMTLMPTVHVDQEILNLVVARKKWLMESKGISDSVWYLPTEFAQYALNQPNEVDKVRAIYQKDFMPPTSRVSKIFVPINDQGKHWYLIVFDFSERKTVVLDSMPTEERHHARRHAVLRVGIFLEGILTHPSYVELVPNIYHYLPTNFNFVHPTWLPHQRPYSNDCGVWVAKWMIEGANRCEYENIIVVAATRMKLALYLALSDNNLLKTELVSKSGNHWQLQLKRRKALVKV